MLALSAVLLLPLIMIRFLMVDKKEMPFSLGQLKPLGFLWDKQHLLNLLTLQRDTDQIVF